MAFYQRLKLPRFKVAKHSICGAVVQNIIGRGLKDNTSLESSNSPEHSEKSEVFCLSKPDSEEWHTFGFASESEDQDVSFHEISQKRSIHAWNSLRESILAAVTECHAMPDGQMCTCCNAVFATFRCIQCGPYMYFCDSCLPRSHLCTNVFHKPECWEVRTFTQYVVYCMLIN